MTPIQTQNLLNIINKGEAPTPFDFNDIFQTNI